MGVLPLLRNSRQSDSGPQGAPAPLPTGVPACPASLQGEGTAHRKPAPPQPLAGSQPALPKLCLQGQESGPTCWAIAQQSFSAEGGAGPAGPSLLLSPRERIRPLWPVMLWPQEQGHLVGPGQAQGSLEETCLPPACPPDSAWTWEAGRRLVVGVCVCGGGVLFPLPPGDGAPSPLLLTHSLPLSGPCSEARALQVDLGSHARVPRKGAGQALCRDSSVRGATVRGRA